MEERDRYPFCVWLRLCRRFVASSSSSHEVYFQLFLFKCVLLLCVEEEMEASSKGRFIFSENLNFLEFRINDGFKLCQDEFSKQQFSLRTSFSFTSNEAAAIEKLPLLSTRNNLSIIGITDLIEWSDYFQQFNEGIVFKILPAPKPPTLAQSKFMKPPNESSKWEFNICVAGNETIWSVKNFCNFFESLPVDWINFIQQQVTKKEVEGKSDCKILNQQIPHSHSHQAKHSRQTLFFSKMRQTRFYSKRTNLSFSSSGFWFIIQGQTLFLFFSERRAWSKALINESCW